MKDIYFLGGLPRSGNTLLSALLNQNPDIYVSPVSPLLNNLTDIEKALNNNEPTQVVNFQEQTTTALKRFVVGFYDHIEKPVILDRNKIWGHKDSILTAYKYITEQPKIIFTVRDIPSILASFITLLGDSQDNFIDNPLKQIGIKPYGKQTQDDLRCDWLMNTQITNCLIALTELLHIQVSVCLVEYDDLVKDPQKELNDIYDFLGLNHFEHDFNNVKKIEQENLPMAGLPNNLHDVRNTVHKVALDPKLVLTKHTQQKYSELEFWRK